jgi:hypothetical protein
MDYIGRKPKPISNIININFRIKFLEGGGGGGEYVMPHNNNNKQKKIIILLLIKG